MNNFAIHAKLFLVAVIWGFGWPAGRVVANDILPFTASWSSDSALFWESEDDVFADIGPRWGLWWP